MDLVEEFMRGCHARLSTHTYQKITEKTVGNDDALILHGCDQCVHRREHTLDRICDHRWLYRPSRAPKVKQVL